MSQIKKIVINSNKIKFNKYSLVDSMLHAYDYCRADYNFYDLRHLACTEVCLKLFYIKVIDFCCFCLMHDVV
jgi:hypothetical protein